MIAPRLVIAIVLFAAVDPALAQTRPELPALAAVPSFGELEAMGAIIGRILVNPQDIFDLDDPNENKALFRLANRLHARTRPETIRRQLLFEPGQHVSVRIIDETERSLRSNRYLQDVSIRPVEYRDGVVDIEVQTRDTWTLDPGVSVARSGGTNSQRIYLNEHNLLGSGMSLGVSHSANVERAGNEVSFANNHLFGTHAALHASYGNLTDGTQWSFGLARPFYSLDTRYAAGMSASYSDAVNKVYEQGVVSAQYRALTRNWEAFGGWSAGRVNGWSARYSAGASYASALYENDATLPSPSVPADRTLAGPFIRYELIEDFYEKAVNREQIGRPEYFAMGFHSELQLGRSTKSMGSTEESWLYSAKVSKGFGSIYSQALLLRGGFSGRMNEATRHDQLLSGAAHYYWPQSSKALFSAALSGDMYRRPDLPAPLQLGGDNGLRGYPLNYQSGERRALLALEERVYTDWYPYRLYRIGGALFGDVGRAWHGAGEVSAGERALSDAGFGLRVADSRSAFGNVLHIDLAFPLNARDQVKSVQFLLKSHTSF
jgi:hemolysin activation/secretion protein